MASGTLSRSAGEGQVNDGASKPLSRTAGEGGRRGSDGRVRVQPRDDAGGEAGSGGAVFLVAAVP